MCIYICGYLYLYICFYITELYQCLYLYLHLFIYQGHLSSTTASLTICICVIPPLFNCIYTCIYCDINIFNCIYSCGNVSAALFAVCIQANTLAATTVNANTRMQAYTYVCMCICVWPVCVCDLCVCLCVCVHVPNADDWQCAASVQDVTAPLCKQCSNARSQSSLGPAGAASPSIPLSTPLLSTMHLWRYDASPAMRALSFWCCGLNRFSVCNCRHNRQKNMHGERWTDRQTAGRGKRRQGGGRQRQLQADATCCDNCHKICLVQHE